MVCIFRGGLCSSSVHALYTHPGWKHASQRHPVFVKGVGSTSGHVRHGSSRCAELLWIAGCNGREHVSCNASGPIPATFLSYGGSMCHWPVPKQLAQWQQCQEKNRPANTNAVLQLLNRLRRARAGRAPVATALTLAESAKSVCPSRHPPDTPEGMPVRCCVPPEHHLRRGILLR